MHKLIFHDKIDNYTQQYNVIERPHLLEGLDMIKDSKKAEIFLFTAGTKEYADGVLNFIDPNRKYFTKVWSRYDCTRMPNYCDTKDLRKLGKYYIPERTTLIDDRQENFFLQPENGYLIKAFNPGCDFNKIFDDKIVSIGSFE